MQVSQDVEKLLKFRVRNWMSVKFKRKQRYFKPKLIIMKKNASKAAFFLRGSVLLHVLE